MRREDISKDGIAVQWSSVGWNHVFKNALTLLRYAGMSRRTIDATLERGDEMAFAKLSSSFNPTPNKAKATDYRNSQALAHSHTSITSASGRQSDKRLAGRAKRRSSRGPDRRYSLNGSQGNERKCIAKRFKRILWVSKTPIKTRLIKQLCAQILKLVISPTLPTFLTSIIAANHPRPPRHIFLSHHLALSRFYVCASPSMKIAWMWSSALSRRTTCRRVLRVSCMWKIAEKW